jgi:hypothetical protein
MILALRLACRSLPMFAVLGVSAAALAGQDQAQPELQSVGRTEAVQIEASEADRRRAAGKAFLETDRAAPAPRPTLMQTPIDQIARRAANTPTSQITPLAQSGSGMAQLSKADLDATLAQLSAAERRVLLQAIEGTDICDNPPNVAAVITLCQTRIETRSADFTSPGERVVSAEERLLRGDFDNAGLPSVGQVIERLARTNAASNDFSNQAIASIALAAPPAPAQPGEDGQTEGLGLGDETQALVNALINQLGGGAP